MNDYRALGAEPSSVVFHHNALLRQSRSAFAHGDYFPALVGACALGERILGHLILALRDDYIEAGAQVYKRFKRDPFKVPWDAACEHLTVWGIFDADLAATFARLEATRHAAVHFGSALQVGRRGPALDAIRAVQDLIGGIFDLPHDSPWVIPDIDGATYRRLEAEAVPLVRRVFVPCAALVSPLHRLEPSAQEPRWRVFDSSECEPATLTDEEFVQGLKGTTD